MRLWGRGVWAGLVLWGLALAAGSKKRNPYAILKIKRNAKGRDIRRAFRQLSKTLHPDKNKGNPELAEKFKDVTWAYDLLGNDTRRTIYDKYGEEGVEMAERGMDPGASQGGFGASAGFGGAGFRGFQTQDGKVFFQGNPFGPGGPFAGFSGPGGGPFQGAGPGAGSQGQRGPPPVAPVNWFNEKDVNLYTKSSSLDHEEMSQFWPDILFVFKETSEAVKAVAEAYVEAAKNHNLNLEFQAIDCRLAPVASATPTVRGSGDPFCQSLYIKNPARANRTANASRRGGAGTDEGGDGEEEGGVTGLSFAIFLANQKTVMRTLERPVGTFKLPASALTPLTHRKVNTEILDAWLMANLPLGAAPVSSFQSLASFVRRAHTHRSTATTSSTSPTSSTAATPPEGLPAVLLIPVATGQTAASAPTMNIQLRKIAIENSNRVAFAFSEPTKSNVKFIDALLSRVDNPPRKAPLLLNLADPELISKETTQVFQLDDNVDVERLISVLVSQKRTKSGIYASASRAVRTFDEQSVPKGVCGSSDRNYCFLFYKPALNSHNVVDAFGETASGAMRLYQLEKPEFTDAIFSLFNADKEQHLIAFKPKRKKFALYNFAGAPKDRISDFFKNAASETFLLTEGTKLSADAAAIFVGPRDEL